MIKIIIKIFLFVFVVCNLIYGCSKIRDSAGVTRKSPDEFKAVENPPLIIPPDYNLQSPDQIEERNIDNVEKELAQEILFGTDQENITSANQVSTMNKILLEAKADKVSTEIRNEINTIFANEIETDSVFQVEWETEREVLDAVKESERIREQTFNDKPLSEGDVPIKKEKIKKKKKKRFLFF